MTSLLPLYTPTDSLDEKEKEGTEPSPSRATVRFSAACPSVDEADTAGEEAQLSEVREQMTVWVDPNETDGLPSLSAGTTTESTAERLAKSYKNGELGFTTSRRRSASTTMTGLADSTAGTSAMDALAGSGGILAALFALNAQSNIDSEALPSPTTPSPDAETPTTPDPPALGDGPAEDSDEELEREVFLARRRAKRASAASLAKAAKKAADLAAELAKSAARSRSADGRPLFQRSLSTSNLAQSHTRNSSPSPLSYASPSSAPRTSPSTTSPPLPSPPIKRNLSSSTLHSLGLVTSRSSTPSPPPSPGLHRPRVHTPASAVAKQMRSVAGRLGLEVDTVDTRPDAARSGAGVFGGLVMSTSSLVGVASPSANSLAPIASKAGYHISRYQTPPSPPSQPPERLRQPSESPQRPPIRPGILRGRSVDSVLKASKPGVSSPLSAPRVEEEDAPLEDEPRGRSAQPIPRRKYTGAPLSLKDLPVPGFKGSGTVSPGSTSARRDSPLRDYFFPAGHHFETDEERDQREWAKEKRKRRKAKEKKMRQEIFITQHVAAILSRQEFILKLARSFMMYGAPTHRLESQIQATARVLELQLQCIYLPGLMLISFGDSQTHTSEIKFLKQANGLDMGKMSDAFAVYNKVIRDKMSVTEGSVQLDEIFMRPPSYKLWQQLLIGALASAFVTPQGFKGSFIDCLAAMPLGALLIFVQVQASRNDLYSSLFEIVMACVNAILAALLARTNQFCFSAVASGGVVLILPAYIVLTGSLELANRSVLAGSVRLVFSLLYTLFLGFGLSLGSEVYQRIAGASIEGATNFTCSVLRVGAPWWRATIPQYFYLLTVPGFLTMLALSSGQPLLRVEVPFMLGIGGAGYAVNFFSSRVFVGQAAITSAFGAFTVSMLANLYARCTQTSAFIVMIAGTFVQLPSGLANGGLLRYASEASSGNRQAFSTGIATAQSIVQVVVGTTIGLFVAAALVNLLFGGGRRRGANRSTF